jgi:hypothetical protein
MILKYSANFCAFLIKILNLHHNIASYVRFLIPKFCQKLPKISQKNILPKNLPQIAENNAHHLDPKVLSLLVALGHGAPSGHLYAAAPAALGYAAVATPVTAVHETLHAGPPVAETVVHHGVVGTRTVQVSSLLIKPHFEQTRQSLSYKREKIVFGQTRKSFSNKRQSYFRTNEKIIFGQTRKSFSVKQKIHFLTNEKFLFEKKMKISFRTNEKSRFRTIFSSKCEAFNLFQN